MDTLLQYMKEFEHRIGVRSGFFNELVREDDWSFVIKLHAFIEACLTNAICAVLGRPELEDVVSRLDTANNQCGKLAIVKRLGMLNKPQRRFVAVLSELRNDLAHNAKSVDFSFKHYMAEMPEQELIRFCTALSLDELFEPDSERNEIRLISYVRDVPKFGIAYTATIVVTELYAQAMSGDLSGVFKQVGEQLVNRRLERQRGGAR